MTDPIADMLTRLRNSTSAGKAALLVPYSKLKSDIAVILKKEGYINDYELETVDGHQQIKITTRFVNKTSAITGLKRVSRPGLRRYVGSRKFPVYSAAWALPFFLHHVEFSPVTKRANKTSAANCSPTSGNHVTHRKKSYPDPGQS